MFPLAGSRSEKNDPGLAKKPLHLFHVEFIPLPEVFVSSVSSGISFSSVQPPLLALEQSVPFQ